MKEKNKEKKFKEYNEVKKEKIDKCNICGKVKHLSWDHVPPKFCFNNKKTKYISMFDIINKNDKYSVSQNGIKFRTICDDCNNKIGRLYDTEYKKLIDIIYEIYINQGETAQYIVIKDLKVNKIARAIAGHFLAARSDYSSSKFENDLRKYVLNDKMLPPKGVSLLYYTYIYSSIMIIRDIVPKNFFKKKYEIPSSFLSCINSFPLAFIIAAGCNNKSGLNDMFDYCTSEIEDKIEIKIDLLSYLYPNSKDIRDWNWPCNVNDSETGVDIVLSTEVAHQESVFTEPRINLEKRKNKAE